MILFFDLETTGVDKSNDRIVEISMIKWSELDYEIKDTKTRLINPLIPIPKAASDVHGITNEDVKDCPSFKQIADSLLDYISGCDIAGYNSNAFDVPILYNEFYRAHIIWDYTNVNFIDVGNIFKRTHERTLAAAYKHYCGEILDNAHSASADVMATLEVFKQQLHHEALPETLIEIAKYSNFDKEIIDLGGCFSKDEEGDYIFNFGKNKGKKCNSDISYLQWMTSQSFLPDAIKICNTIINN